MKKLLIIRLSSSFVLFFCCIGIHAQDSHAKPNTDDSVSAVTALLKVGIAAATGGNYDEAIRTYSQAIALDPHNAEAFFRRGSAYGHKGDLNQVVRDSSQAISLNPKFAAAFRNRGAAHVALGEVDEALADLNQAVALDPKDANTFTDRGDAYLKIRNFDAAVKDFTQAISLDPNDGDNFGNRALAYQLMGNFQAAISDCNRSLTINSKSAQVHFIRGVCLVNQRTFPSALADFTASITLDPQNPLFYQNRAALEQRLGQEDTAMTDLARAQSLTPSSNQAMSVIDVSGRPLPGGTFESIPTTNAGVSAEQDMTDRLVAERIDPGAVTLPFTDAIINGEDNYTPVVLAHIGTETGATFMVDTGASQTSITHSFAKQLGLSPKPWIFEGRRLQMNGHDVDFVVAPIFQIGGRKGKNIRMAVLDDEAFHRIAQTVDGILGDDILSNYCVLFDFSRHRLTLMSSHGLTPAQYTDLGFGSQAAEIAMSRNTFGTYTVELSLTNGNNHVTETAFVDTGSGVTDVSLKTAKDLHLFSVLSSPSKTTGLYWEANTTATVIDQIQVGHLRITKSKVHSLLSEKDDNGKRSLGMNILSHCRALLDFPGRKMYLVPLTQTQTDDNLSAPMQPK